MAASTADAYPTQEFKLGRCACGSDEHFICDSGEYWEDSEPETLSCIEGKSQRANVGVGFALYPDDGEVKWLYVGYRCANCGNDQRGRSP